MKVQVLMSTYNGEKYVEEQIRSIEENRKDDIEIYLIIRDDGSSDRTIEIIENLIVESKVCIRLIRGENLGPPRSFLELIRIASSSDLYFLCDQDDVWDARKIQVIANTGKNRKEIPQLYISGYYLANEKLDIMRECNYENKVINTLLQILFANIAPGCTMAFNDMLLQELKKDMPKDVPMHDIYILITAYCTGEINYVKEPLMYYRQHGNNTEGVQSKKINWKRVLQKQKKLLTYEGGYTVELARYVQSEYSQILSVAEMKKLQLVLEYKNSLQIKFRLMKQKEIYYHNIRSDLLTLEKVLLNKY